MEKWEQKTLVSELLQGFEMAKQLQGQLGSSPSPSPSPPETREMLAQRILTSYEKALMILNWSGAMGKAPSASESPLSINGSPWSDNNLEEGHQEHKHVSKKRKLMPKWTDQVKINFENGFEGPHEDGHSWRKYGQKDILGAKYPRAYYRCTFRSSKNCWATKQVQRSEDDPSVFNITYRGRHACGHITDDPNPPNPPPSKQENDHHHHDHHHHHQKQSQEEALFNFRANLRVNTTDLDINDYTFLPSPSFFSPCTPETSYLSLPQCHMRCFGGIMSTDTSTTNSPIVNLDFGGIDPVEIDPYFPFGNSEFFS